MITVWWEGLPGMDWRYLPADAVFGDRMTAIACAIRLHGVDPSVGAAGSRAAENTADMFFTWLQEAKTPWEGYLRRLSLAMACSGGRSGIHASEILKRAQWYRRYLTKPATSRGGWI